MTKLVIGAGDRRVEGFSHHDVQPLDGIDIVCEFWDLPKHVKKGSCEEIHMTHVLEHFPMKDTQKVLLLVKSLLKKGGKLYLEVPNFYWHALGILSNPLNRQMIEYAFGGQLNEWDFHYNGFTPEILHEDLQLAGFTVDILNPNSSLEAWATK
jgi:hypothetical protein